MITIDDFKKLDLRVAKIVSAERVENSEKLLKLVVDLGGLPVAERKEANQRVSAAACDSDVIASRFPSAEKGGELRQIVAGIGRQYAPEKLVGMEIVIVANLEPKRFILRQSQGQEVLESNGMLLAADAENGPVVLIPEKPILPGTRIC